MGKHAYLIICHNKWEQLQFLISVLNDPRNDFFILVDSKSKDFDRDSFVKKCASKQLYFADPVGIYWGDYSQVQAELSLLKKATSTGKYDYYHLISGVDMPLRPQDEMHRFFEENAGTEFVDFDSFEDGSWALERLGFYYFLQKNIGRRKINVLKFMRDFLVVVQKVLHVNRCKGIEQYLAKGANWFSITDDFARFIVDNEDFVEKHFKRTYCADEEFVQIMLKVSPYRDNWYGFKNRTIHYQNLRLLDWGRGAPYTYKKEEYFDLCKSEYLFARKFSDDIMAEDIRGYLKPENG